MNLKVRHMQNIEKTLPRGAKIILRQDLQVTNMRSLTARITTPDVL